MVLIAQHIEIPVQPLGSFGPILQFRSAAALSCTASLRSPDHAQLSASRH
jgi:hypothetical protein